jgi:archaellum component FlaG (FlaF/FlaG flagellin family)
MRQKATTTGSYFTTSPLGEAVPGIRAFNMSSTEKKKAIAEARKTLEENWPNVQPLVTGAFSAFSPYAFLHRANYQWYPSPQQKEAAIKNLPYIKSNRFIHQKMDSRHPTVFTYVRQPGYYACFNSGPQLKLQQRYGLGLLWHPKAGAFLQSQTDTDDAAWGTKPEGGRLYEADTLNALFFVDNKAIAAQNNQDIKAGTLTINYTVGTTGKKSIIFRDQTIEVAIQHPGHFTEYIPLLLNPADSVHLISPGKVKLEKQGGAILILYDAAAKASLKETTLKSGMQRVTVLTIESSDKLDYSFKVQ